MLRNAARLARSVAAALAAAACSDALTPQLSVQLGRAGRHVSVRSDSLATPLDSVRVILSGPGADTARWIALHSGDGAVTLATPGGSSGAWLRWVRDETVPPGGEPFVDTIVVVSGRGSPAVLVESLTVRLMPTRYVAAKRAWLPGERDSVVARIVAQRTLALPYVGDISDNADDLIPLDSATEIVPNPLFPSPRASSRALFSSFATVPGAGWQIMGMKIHTVNDSAGGAEITWLGYIFWNTADPTWKGLVFAASGAAAVNKVVNTPAFDASAGTSGAGGAEILGTYPTATLWQGNGLGSPNRVRVTASHFDAPTTVTTGPFLGGTQATGLMTGSLEQIVLTRVTGSLGDAADTASVSFSDLASMSFECIYPTPCTTNVPTAGATPRWLRSGPPRP